MKLSAVVRGVVLAVHITLLAGMPALAGFAGALLALPLLAPLRGLWRGTPYTYAWCSLLLAFYAGGWLMEAVATKSVLVTLLASAAAVEFCALLLYVRFRSVEQHTA